MGMRLNGYEGLGFLHQKDASLAYILKRITQFIFTRSETGGQTLQKGGLRVLVASETSPIREGI